MYVVLMSRGRDDGGLRRPQLPKDSEVESKVEWRTVAKVQKRYVITVNRIRLALTKYTLVSFPPSKRRPFNIQPGSITG